jgi:hypothetical protein
MARRSEGIGASVFEAVLIVARRGPARHADHPPAS